MTAAAPAFSLALEPGHDLVVSVDTLVSGVHFPPDTPAARVGHKAAAVNLSDLAAMGALPRWASIALDCPDPDSPRVGAFADGFRLLAQRYGLSIMTMQVGIGPAVVTVQVYGTVAAGAALTRAGARAGDAIYVTGTLGDAGAALAVLEGRLDLEESATAALRERLDRPMPRVAEGLVLVGLASAAIDLSDGLAGDLGHVLAASGTGATVELGRLPLSRTVRTRVDRETAWQLAISAGDDYELLFTVPPTRAAALERVWHAGLAQVTRIGTVEATAGLRCLRPDGTIFPSSGGYEHFA